MTDRAYSVTVLSRGGPEPGKKEGHFSYQYGIVEKAYGVCTAQFTVFKPYI